MFARRQHNRAQHTRTCSTVNKLWTNIIGSDVDLYACYFEGGAVYDTLLNKSYMHQHKMHRSGAFADTHTPNEKFLLPDDHPYNKSAADANRDTFCVSTSEVHGAREGLTFLFVHKGPQDYSVSYQVANALRDAVLVVKMFIARPPHLSNRVLVGDGHMLYTYAYVIGQGKFSVEINMTSFHASNASSASETQVRWMMFAEGRRTPPREIASKKPPRLILGTLALFRHQRKDFECSFRLRGDASHTTWLSCTFRMTIKRHDDSPQAEEAHEQGPAFGRRK